MSKKPTTVTYLEMHERPNTGPLPTIDGVSVQRLRCPSVSLYRELYNGVGQDYDWTDRNRLDDRVLKQLIENPGVEVHRLCIEDETAGFCELDQRNPHDVQLVYFGLYPGYIGRGLGRYFLAWVVQHVWASEPRRLWLHTCGLDHPAALPNYQRAGFRVYRTERPDGFAKIPRS